MRILIASPEPAWQEILASSPGQSGWVVRSAESGSQVMEMLKDTRPDLLIVDERLPDCSSLELIRKVVLANPMINTAVVTDMNRKELHEKFEGLGVLAALSHDPGPDEAAELLMALNRVLASSD
ncbi:response regulator [Desulfonatronovibrio hydrogenovorans]|uniref:response regulator n=1 Tax=Desulfonatronovibrio hydrogenovorans TaxID=53245 RepID=UPI00068C1282|nr:response regulator [Desulfonatronovibrio hydrogenovorans]